MSVPSQTIGCCAGFCCFMLITKRQHKKINNGMTTILQVLRSQHEHLYNLLQNNFGAKTCTLRKPEFCTWLNHKIMSVWPTALDLAVRSILPTVEHPVWWLGHWLSHLGEGGAHHHSNSLAGAWPQSWWGCFAQGGALLSRFTSPADTVATRRRPRWRVSACYWNTWTWTSRTKAHGSWSCFT